MMRKRTEGSEMVEIEIGRNEAEQRLDRFLRKYLKGASLSYIYRIIRKDVKVNGKEQPKTRCFCGDRIFLYLSEEELKRFRPKQTIRKRVKRQFGIAYEDENILAAERNLPDFDSRRSARKKENTLVNQSDGLSYRKRAIMFRARKRAFLLQRQIVWTVIPQDWFCSGKNSAALRTLNGMIGDKDAVGKYYLTIVCGELEEEMQLTGSLSKDHAEIWCRLSKILMFLTMQYLESQSPRIPE